MTTRRTKFGSPTPTFRSELTTIIVEPSGGFRGDVAPTNLPLGATPSVPVNENSQNLIFRDGALQLRPTLSSHTSNPNPIGFVTGGAQIESSVASRYQLASSTTRFAYYSVNSWSPLSYVSAFGNSAPPSITTYERTKVVQIYEPRVDDMIAVVSATSSYQTMFSWQAGATVFSALTSAPRARWVEPFDNFLVAGNIRDVGSAQSKYVQRMQWSDRGNPSNWTSGLAGNQDLLDARGQIQQILAEETRLVIFTDHEIWVGGRDVFPNTFRFSAIDRTVGTKFGMTCAKTPLGIMFLGSDFMVYLLPKDGGKAVPVGEDIQGALRDRTGVTTANAMPLGVYDRTTASYQLYVPAAGGVRDACQVSFHYNMHRRRWMYQEFGPYQGFQGDDLRRITAVWPGEHSVIQGGAETWSSVSGVYTWETNPFTWLDYQGTESIATQTTFVGLSTGTINIFEENVFTGAGPTDNVGTGGSPTVHGLWNSPPLGGENPEALKCVTGFRVDYTSALASSVSVRFLGQINNAGIGHESRISLDASGVAPQASAQAFPFISAKYPVFQVLVTSRFPKLLRFWVSMRIGGR